MPLIQSICRVFILSLRLGSGDCQSAVDRGARRNACLHDHSATRLRSSLGDESELKRESSDYRRLALRLPREDGVLAAETAPIRDVPSRSWTGFLWKTTT